MSRPRGEIRTYTLIDHLALNLYLTDIRLHAACDQADSGFWLKEAYLEVTDLNCHRLWDNLPIDQKTFYRKAASASIYEDVEITRLSKKIWSKLLQ